MPNTTSAKEQARQNIKRRAVNLARKSAVKSAVKKVKVALEEAANPEELKALLRDAESKLAREKGKRKLHPKTVSRKISRLAKKVAAATRTDSK